MHDRDRFLMTLCLPRPQREAVFTLLALNIEISRIPETVSEAMIGHIRFAWWREALLEAEQGKVREHPVVQAVAGLMQSQALDSADFTPLLDARETQFETSGFKTLAALEEYAVATSSGLLFLCLKSNRQWQSEYKPAVRHLGIAWALVGMLRSLPYLAAQNRSPFPHDLFKKHGVLDIHDASDEEKYRAAIAVSLEMLDIAKAHFVQAQASMPAQPPKLLSVYTTATRHYCRMLEGKENSLLALPANAGRLWLPLKLLFT